MDRRWAPNQNYKVAAVPLDGGLDFVSPPSMVKPGTLTDCLNYEVVDRNGYRRIDGYYRWDNAYQFEDDRPYYIEVTETAAGASAVGDYLVTFDTTFSFGTGSLQQRVFGLLLNIIPGTGSAATLVYMRLASEFEPKGGESVATLRSAATSWTCTSPIPAAWDEHIPLAFKPADETSSNAPSLLYPTANAVYGTDRPTIGLKYFNNAAYKITDAYVISVAVDADDWLYPGDVIGEESSSLLVLKATPFGFGVGTQNFYAEVMWLGGRANTVGTSLDYSIPYYINNGFVSPVLARTGASVSSLTFVTTSVYRPQFAVLYEAEKLTSLLYLNSKGRLGEGIVTNAGSCTAPPTVSVTGSGFGGKAVALWDSSSGVRGLAVTNQGTGYNLASTTITGAGTAAGSINGRNWQWAGWRALNTGWKFSTQNVSSASGFLTKVDRTRGPSSQVSAYSTGSSQGLPFALDSFNQLNITGLPGTNITAAFGVAASTDPTILHTTDSNRLTAGLRSSQYFGPFNTTPFGMRDFTSARDNIPTGSVVTGFEFNFTYYTNDFDSNTPPAASELVNYKAKAALYRRTVDEAGAIQYTLLSDIREADLTATGAAENVTPVSITIGASDDLWGVDGVTIDEITTDVGVAFWIEGVPTSGASFGYTFEIDTVNLEVSYRSPQVTYYFAGGTATERNVMSATLVSYHRESGELTQNNWKGDWQVADLGVEKYCAAGSVGLVKITNGGSGYTTAPTVTFNDPSTGGESGAAGTAIIEDGKVVGVVITNGGTGYTSATTVTFSAPGAGTTATGTVVVGALPGIQSGMGIYLDSALTTRIGFVSSDMEYNGLDSYTALEEEQSRYQIISANFYADEAWEGIYGVSGAGRAWYFDGNYFSRIYAVPLNVDESERKDKPRHICNYRFHLALGYKSGSVQFSKVGEPENFDFVLGATEVGIGDRVTGIFPLPGQYLAVFCENSIWGITGKTVSEFSLENISPYSGAIEYSVVAIGDKPIYCDTMGISTLEQSDKYGNFLGNRLSHKISPWLLPRLANQKNTDAGLDASGFIAAYAVRNKNQYRLWFKDGYQLVMSFVGPEQEPQFTFTRYLFGGFLAGGTVNSPLLYNSTDRLWLLAIDSDVDSDGKEQIFASFDLVKSQLNVLESQRLVIPAVYKLDYLNQFGDITDVVGETTVYKPLSIPAYIQTAFNTIENPFANKTIRKVRLEGASRGVSSLAITTDKNYANPVSGVDTAVNCPLDKVETYPLNPANKYTPASNIANVAETDRVITIKLDNLVSTKRSEINLLTSSYAGNNIFKTYTVTKVPTVDDSTFSAEPSHYIQLMLIQYEEGKQDA